VAQQQCGRARRGVTTLQSNTGAKADYNPNTRNGAVSQTNANRVRQRAAPEVDKPSAGGRTQANLGLDLRVTLRAINRTWTSVRPSAS
jgi:hypothetical protein